MAKIIEAKVVLTGEDKGVVATFSKVAKSVDGIAKSAKAFNGLKPTKAFDDMAKSAKALNGIKPMAGWGASFQKEIEKMSLSSRELLRVQREFKRFQEMTPRFRASQYMRDFDTWKTRTIRGIHEVRREQERLEHRARRLRNVPRAIGNAAGIYTGGYVANRSARATVTAGAESARESARDYLAGLPDGESARLKTAAEKLSEQYKSIPATVMHGQLREAATSMRSIDKAVALGGTLAEALTVLKTMKGADRAPEELRRYLAGLDVVGKNQDPAEVRQLLNSALKAMQTEGADMDFGGLLQAVRQARSAGSVLSNRFMTNALPALGRDMGDAQVGTALSSGLSQVIGGRATKKSKVEQYRYGLRRKGVFKDSEKFMRDPDLWAWENLTPALKKRKVNVDDETAVAAAISKLFSNRTVADLMTKLVVQREQYQAKYRQYDQNPGLKAAEELPKRDPFVAWSAATAQLNNALAAIAEPQTERAISVLNNVASGLGQIAKFAREEPKKAQEIVNGAVPVGLGVLGAGANAAGAAIGGLSGFLLRAFGHIIGPFGPALSMASQPDIQTKAPDGRPFVEVLRERAWKGKSFTLDNIQQALYGPKVVPPEVERLLKRARQIDNWQGALDKTALGGAFRASQLKRIEQARAELLPELERLGYVPSASPQPGAGQQQQQPMTAANIAKALGFDKLVTSETRVTAELKGEATVSGKAEVTINIPGFGVHSAMIPLSGTVSANGPGSLGTSSPDAAAMPVGGR